MDFISKTDKMKKEVSYIALQDCNAKKLCVYIL